MKRVIGVAVVLLCACADNRPVERRNFVVSRLDTASTNNELTALGLDLDGDHQPDNRYGAFQAWHSSMGAIDFQAETDRMIATGAALLLLQASAQSYEEDPTTTVAVLEGATSTPAPCADPLDLETCSRHLDGHGAFTLASDPLPPLDGLILASSLEGGPGQARVPLALVGGAWVWIDAVGVWLHAEVGADGLTAGQLGGGIRKADVDGVLIPELHANIEQLILRDCPSGCQDGSIGKNLVNLYDTDHDSRVTLQEFRAHEQIVAQFAADLDLEGNDGVKDALSFGFGFESVTAEFDGP